MQRVRILDAVVEVVGERGFAGASVKLVSARARVSSRTFYEQFAGLQEGVIAVMDRTLEQVGVLASRAFEEENEQQRSWWDGMRAALGAVLEFFDCQPALARVCLVETLAAGPVVREHFKQTMEAFRALVVERIEPQVSHASPLAAEGLLASVVGIVGARLSVPEPPPLITLLGPLMGVLVGSFMDDAGVAREISKGDALAREMLSAAAQRQAVPADTARMRVEVPAVLLAPRAHRARRCLLYVVNRVPADRRSVGGGPSNQEVGRGIGVPHRGQVAKLLGRLEALGLLVKRSGGPGRPNVWSATAAGEQVARTLAEYPQR